MTREVKARGCSWAVVTVAVLGVTMGQIRRVNRGTEEARTGEKGGDG